MTGYRESTGRRFAVSSGCRYATQTAADVILAQCGQLVQMFLHLQPRPVQIFRFDTGRIDQDFIRHQPRPFRGQLKSTIRTLAPRIVGDLLRHSGARGFRLDLLILFDCSGESVQATSEQAVFGNKVFVLRNTWNFALF